MKQSLTPKQKKVLDFLIKFHSEKGFYPSYSEIRRIHRRSLSTIWQIIYSLQSKGWFKRQKFYPRSYEIK